MTLIQMLRIAVVSLLVIALWAWVDPAWAVVAGMISIGVFCIASLRSKPRWVKAFWSFCKDVGQNER